MSHAVPLYAPSARETDIKLQSDRTCSVRLRIQLLWHGESSLLHLEIWLYIHGISHVSQATLACYTKVGTYEFELVW